MSEKGVRLYERDDKHPQVMVVSEMDGGIWDDQSVERALEHALEFHREQMAKHASEPVAVTD